MWKCRNTYNASLYVDLPKFWKIKLNIYFEVHVHIHCVPCSLTGDQRAPNKANLNDGGFQAKGQQSCRKDNSVIEISSDDNDDDGDIDSNNDMDVDSVKDVKFCSNSLEYPGKLFYLWCFNFIDFILNLVGPI